MTRLAQLRRGRRNPNDENRLDRWVPSFEHSGFFCHSSFELRHYREDCS
jgi:hypothetical protein